MASSDGFYTPEFENFGLAYTPIPTYTLSYSASSGGHISGSATQTVYYGDDGSSVTATPDSGYYFSGWDDGNKESSRTDTNIKANFSAVAKFIHNSSNSFVPPSTPKISVEPSFSGNTINWSVTNVYQMAVSESADFSKSSWVPYKNSYQQTDKKLYIKFRSQDGGESKVYIISPENNDAVANSKQLTAAAANEPAGSAKPVVSVKPVVAVKQTYNFKKDLKLGMNTTDVRELQKFLNSQGFFVASKGVGAPGQESTYFGRMTSAALVRFQKANKIFPALGFFGPITRKVAAEK